MASAGRVTVVASGCATPWWPLLRLLRCLEAGEGALSWRRMGSIRNGAEGFCGIGIIGCTGVVGNGGVSMGGGLFVVGAPVSCWV